MSTTTHSLLDSPRRAASPSRLLELLLLTGALALTAFGLHSAWTAKAPTLGAAELVDLSASPSAQSLLPALASLRAPAEERFIAARLASALAGRETPLTHIGALSALRVAAADLAGCAECPHLANGLARQSSTRLLDARLLAAAKPFWAVRSPAAYRTALLGWSIAAGLSFLALHVLWRFRRFGGDPILLPAAALLCGLGLIYMVSLRDPLRDTLEFRSFALGILFGQAAIAAVTTFDLPALLRRFFALPFLGSIALFLALLAFGSGPGRSDARVNLLGIQPIEIIKLLLAFALAGYFERQWEKLRHLSRRQELVPLAAALAISLVFLVALKDMGPALILGLTFVLLYCVTLRGFVPFVLGAIVLGAAVWAVYHYGLSGTIRLRIDMWLDPWTVPFGRSTQLADSLWAFASGGPLGNGIGYGMPSFIPAGNNDLVLAGLAEEMGVPAVLAVFALLGVIVWRAFGIALRSEPYSFYLALSLTLLLALQAALIIAGTVGAFPLSGVVLPFLSAGKTSMAVNLATLGILLALSDRAPVATAEARFGPPLRTLGAALGLIAVLLAGRALFLLLYLPDAAMARAVKLQQWTAADDEERRDKQQRYGEEYLDLYNPRLLATARTLPRGTVFDRHGLPLVSSSAAALAAQQDRFAALGVRVTDLAPSENGRYYPFGAELFYILSDIRRLANEQLQGYRDYAELVPLWRHRADPDHPAARALRERNRDVRSTIDIALQLATSRALAARAKTNPGAAVVLDPASGDVLALAVHPLPAVAAGDPEISDANGASTGLNLARLGLYPPGSTFKTLVAMAALRARPDALTVTHECGPLPAGRVGLKFRYRNRDYTIRDAPGDPAHGKIALEQALVVSCNAYFAQLGSLEVGAAQLREAAAIYGIRLDNPNYGDNLEATMPQASYGQGEVVVTPWQMAEVAATAASHGSYLPARLLADAPPARRRLVLSPDRAAPLATALRGVVTRGTAAGKFAADPPAAGKTGTATRNNDPRDTSWFIGFAPYDAPAGAPQLALSVVVPNGGAGSRTAAPIANDIFQAARQQGLFTPHAR